MIHDENYVDPVTGTHTQGVERQWVEVKAWWRRSHVNKALLQSHVDELAWRALHRDRGHSMALFEQFLAHVKVVHCAQH